MMKLRSSPTFLLIFSAISACDSNPCNNGGACTIVNGDCSTYMCVCPNCRTGDNCEIRKCSDGNFLSEMGLRVAGFG